MQGGRRGRDATFLACEVLCVSCDVDIQAASQSLILRKRAVAGMTLIEVLVALVVFTLGSISFTVA